MQPDFEPAKTSRLQRICLSLFGPVDNSFLIFFRIVFGAIMAWEVYRYLSHTWISVNYIKPTVYFTYYGFSWIKPWPGNGMYVHFYVLGALALCVCAGFFYRIAITLFFLGFSYVFLLDQTRYLNHFYLVCLISLIMIFLPAERALSVDALIRPRIRSNTAPAWTLWLLRMQIGVAYFFGGLAKLNSDWFHGQPMRIWLSPLTRLQLFGPLFAKEWVVYSFAIGGFLLDLFVVPLLLWRRTRPFAVVAAIVFNLLNSLIFQIGIFPWFMLGATFIFFPPDTVRRFLRWVLRQFESAASEDTPTAKAVVPEPITEPESVAAVANPDFCSRRQKVIATVLAAYLILQFTLPLRHYLYPGNVSWTEEGHNFAWHMKLRTKRGEAFFTVTHPPTGQTWTVDPKEHLEPRQLQRMATHPDMILQFSHYLAELKRREGFENVEVRATAMVSLNGRKRQMLIDPTADLTKERISLLPARWILPLTEPLPVGGLPAEEGDDADRE